MTDFYIVPAGSGTSGNGLSRKNPIVGLSSVNNNAIGAQSGDRLIFLPGTHYEQFVVPTNELTIISEDTIFDGTDSLNGLGRLNSSTWYHESSGSAWQQVSTNPNIWKKGSGVAGFTFMDGVWLEPMPTSRSTNNYATHVLPVIGINEITVLTETLDGGNRATYICLPLGDSPNYHDIRASGRRTANTTSQSGLIEATDKVGLTFEGEFNVFGYYNMVAHSSPFLFKRCTGVTNYNGQFKSRYSQWGTFLVAPNDVKIRAYGEYLLNAAVAIGAADEITGTLYTGGNVEIFDWYANYCGWMPRYNYVDLRFGDADGGVAVGYRGGTLGSITIRDGVSLNGGPSVSTLKTGWLGTINVGSGIFFGTADPLIISGDVKVFGNRIDSAHRNGIAIGGSNILYSKEISINGNFIKNHRAMTLADNVQTEVLQLRVIKAGSTTTRQVIANNTIVGGNHTISAIGAGNSKVLSTPIVITNNIIQQCPIVSGYASNYGMIRVIDANTSVTINGNITDIADGGVIGKIGSSALHTTMSSWRAAGYDINGQQGTVTIATNGAPSAGTANPIGTGLKWWGNNARPVGIDGNPFPDTNIDIGCFQTSTSLTHPVNIVSASNIHTSENLYNLIQSLTTSVTSLQTQLDAIESFKFSPSIYSGEVTATTTVTNQSEIAASGTKKLFIENKSLVNSVYIGLGGNSIEAETNCSTGWAGSIRHRLLPDTSAYINLDGCTHFAWVSLAGTATIKITQGV
jgi:hypothetical protein